LKKQTRGKTYTARTNEDVSTDRDLVSQVGREKCEWGVGVINRETRRVVYGCHGWGKELGDPRRNEGFETFEERISNQIAPYATSKNLL